MTTFDTTTPIIPPDSLSNSELDGIIMISAIASISKRDEESTWVKLINRESVLFNLPIAAFRNAIIGNIQFITYTQKDVII